MKFNNPSQALLLLVTISFGSLWGAVAADPVQEHRTAAHDALANAYRTNTQTDALAALRTTLKDHADFSFLDDRNLVRNLETGYYMRMAVLKLDGARMLGLISLHGGFFETSLGASLLYMWMAKESGLFYVAEFSGPKYSFARVYERMAHKASVGAPALEAVLKHACATAIAKPAFDPLTFLGQILYFPFELGKLQERQALPAVVENLLVTTDPQAYLTNFGQEEKQRNQALTKLAMKFLKLDVAVTRAVTVDAEVQDLLKYAYLKRDEFNVIVGIDRLFAKPADSALEAPELALLVSALSLVKQLAKVGGDEASRRATRDAHQRRTAADFYENRGPEILKIIAHLRAAGANPEELDLELWKDAFAIIHHVSFLPDEDDSLNFQGSTMAEPDAQLVKNFALFVRGHNPKFMDNKKDCSNYDILKDCSDTDELFANASPFNNNTKRRKALMNVLNCLRMVPLE